MLADQIKKKRKMMNECTSNQEFLLTYLPVTDRYNRNTWENSEREAAECFGQTTGCDELYCRRRLRQACC